MKAQFLRELSYNPGLLYASPKGAPKPLAKAPSPMFKSAGTTAATGTSVTGDVSVSGAGRKTAGNNSVSGAGHSVTESGRENGVGSVSASVTRADGSGADFGTGGKIGSADFDWQDYAMRSLRQIILGNYTDDVTLAGTVGQMALGALGLDTLADLRDLSYDLMNFKTTSKAQILLDVVALLPFVGMLKYADEAKKSGKLALNALNSTKAFAGIADKADGIANVVKAAGKASNTVDAAQSAAKTAGKTAAGTKLPPEVIEARKKQLLEAIKENLDAHPMPDFAGKSKVADNIMHDLDQKTQETYNTIIQEYNKAASKSVGNSVTYYRIQGGIKNPELGLNRSQIRIIANEDGSISIPKKNKNLSISAYTLDHVNHYKNTRGASAQIIAFDVPRWLDDFMRENAVLQKGYTTNMWNQGGAAPKIPDINQPGYPYELPPPWPEWLEEYGYNSRYIK